MGQRPSKILGICIFCTSAMMFINGCHSEYELTELSQLSKICELSGGEFVNDRCSCAGFLCDPGFVCELNTGKCSAESGVFGTCVTDSTYCQNGKLQKCVEGVWSTATACESMICESVERCAEPCVHSTCSNAQLRKCEGGMYQKPSPCPHGCNDDRTDCATSACNNGAFRCKENVSESCISGSWGNDLHCKLGCDEQSQKCVAECTEGDTRCYENENGEGTQDTCIHGVWEPSPCLDDAENPLSCDGKVCGECKNSQIPYDCEDDNNWIGSTITCTVGKKIYTKCPDPVSCDKSHPGQCGTCKNGQARCNTEDGSMIGYLSICEDGRFSEDDAQKCENDASCLNDTMCGYCRTGADMFCEEPHGYAGIIRTCENGQYSSGYEGGYLECFDGTSCNADQTACGICTNYDIKCAKDEHGSAAFYRCISGDWEKQNNCPSNQCDSDGKHCSD